MNLELSIVIARFLTTGADHIALGFDSTSLILARADSLLKSYVSSSDNFSNEFCNSTSAARFYYLAKLA
jgi:hypothetical protein